MSTIILTCLATQIPFVLGILPAEFGPLSKGYPPVAVRNLSDHHNWPSWNRENRTEESGRPLFPGENRTDEDRHQSGRRNGTFPGNGNSEDDRMHPIFPRFPKIANHSEGPIRRNWTATPLPDILAGGNGLENETDRRRIARASGENDGSLVDDNHSPLLPQENNTDNSTASSVTAETFPTPSGVFVGAQGLPLQIEDPNPPAPVPIFPQGPFPTNTGSGFPRPGNGDDDWLRGSDSVPRLQIEDPNPPAPIPAYPPGPFPDEHASLVPPDEHAPILPPDEHAPLSPADEHAPISPPDEHTPIAGTDGNQNLPEAVDNNGQRGQIGGANGVENWGLPGFPPLPAM